MSDIEICKAVAMAMFGDLRSDEAIAAGARLVEPYMDAAMPIIERSVRAKVCDELRSEARGMRDRQSHVREFIDGIQVAANMAVSGGSRG